MKLCDYVIMNVKFDDLRNYKLFMFMLCGYMTNDKHMIAVITCFTVALDHLHMDIRGCCDQLD